MAPNEGTEVVTNPGDAAPSTATAIKDAPASAPAAPAEKKEGEAVSSLAQLKELAKKDPEAPAPEAEAEEEEAPSDEKDPDAPGTIQAAEKAPFVPNFKLKVMDKDFEIPEHFRALMKDEASAKEVREIFEKAYGLDYAKPKHIQTQKQLQELAQTHQQVSTKMQTWEGNAKKLETAAASNDPFEFEQFLSFWGVSKEKLYGYTNYLLQLEDMSPEQRAVVEGAKQDRLQARQATEKAQQLQGSQENSAVQALLGEVDRHVARPDISEVAKQYNAQRGNADAFKNLVIERGWLAKQQGKDLSAEAAVREAMAVLGYEEVDAAAEAPIAPQGAQAPAQAIAPPVIPAAPKKLPTLPTVGSGSGNAPVKKVVGSIADLRKIRTDMMANQT